MRHRLNTPQQIDPGPLTWRYEWSEDHGTTWTPITAGMSAREVNQQRAHNQDAAVYDSTIREGSNYRFVYEREPITRD